MQANRIKKPLNRQYSIRLLYWPKLAILRPYMTMTTHVAVGATIGLAMHNPVLGFALGLGSHFLLDMLPHGDSSLGDKHFNSKKSVGPYAYVAIDNVLAIYLLLAIVNVVPSGAIAALTGGVAGSILPDVLVGVYEASRRRWLKGFFAFHLRVHNYFTSRVGDIPLFAGIGYQAAFILFLFIIQQ